jgi:hypothetical protein
MGTYIIRRIYDLGFRLREKKLEEYKRDYNSVVIDLD